MPSSSAPSTAPDRDEHADHARVRERMQLLSAASFEGLFFHVDGLVIDANDRLSEITGYSREEILGDTLLQRCVAPEDLPNVLERMATRYEGEYVITGVRKDGSRIRVELQAKQGKLGDRPVRVVAVRDVTERERTQALLCESEQRLRELASSTFDLTVFSRDGVIVEVSGPLERVLGYRPEQWVGRRILEFVALAAAPRIGEAIAQGRSGVFETLALRADGEEVPMEVVAVQTTLRGEPIRMSALRDLRAAKRQEQERRELERAFEQSQRLDSLGVLAGGIAHDFNNLLTVVLGNADLLRKRLPDADERALAQAIVDAGQRAASLTAQMLAYAGRSEVGPRMPVDLGQLAQDLRALLGAALSKKADVSLEAATDCVVLGNRATLTQVLMNLLTNASDALADEPGTITVRITKLDDPGPRFTRALGAKLGPGRFVLIEVRDSGVGMDEATQARIFEPFFTTKEKGHGLGLAACVGIVSSHGGAILVESERGGGSTFAVVLPAHEHAARALPTHDAEVSATAQRVLVVDDEPLVRAHLRSALEHQGYVVEEASSGKAALESVARREPHAIVLDVTMPDLSGIEVLRRLRADGSRVPVVLSSGYHDVAIDAKQNGFQAFLTKPYTLGELLETVARVLAPVSAQPAMPPETTSGTTSDAGSAIGETRSRRTSSS